MCGPFFNAECEIRNAELKVASLRLYPCKIYYIFYTYAATVI